MLFKQTNIISVKYWRGKVLVPVGRLALQNRKIFFEYASSFLELNLELSPFKLPLKAGLTVCEERIFDGIFGVFNDSLPDGWGRLLLDRKLMKMGINSDHVTPLDRLGFVGSRGMGALVYEPEMLDIFSSSHQEDLDLIAEDCLQFQAHDDDQFVDELFALNGSSAGARPKILVSLCEEKLATTNNNPNARHNDWIIKFRSSLDPKDMGPIEYAYHLMAIEAGLDVPEARLFTSKKCKGYFGVRRFDRQESKFIHMHTLGGLLHLDHRIPSLDYETLIKATLWLTKDVREGKKQFRNAVFNIFAHNRDDHAKNFSFLMDENGVWRVSPVYDLTFSSGPAGEHCTMVMGEGKTPGVTNLLKLAEVALIEPKDALAIIDQVKSAVSRWSHFAKEAHVSASSCKNIQIALDRTN
jgi:serine/threonine-protein kinase HipA